MVAATACPAAVVGVVVVGAAEPSSPLRTAAVSAAIESAAVTKATGTNAAFGSEATTSVRNRGRHGWATIAGPAVGFAPSDLATGAGPPSASEMRGSAGPGSRG